MKSVKRLSRYTSILLSMLLMLSAMSPGISALAQERANAAPTVLTYEDDSITAELKATGGTSLPAGAALTVKALNKDSQDEAEKALYAETEVGLKAKASEQGTTVDGFTAYSVKLQNKEGKDMTPAQGEYTLKVTYKEATAPEAFLNSESAEKGVTLYQKTEGKDEQNNTIYTMEVTGEEDTKITADANGKVQAVESKITTLQPIALAWQSVTQAETGNVTAEVSEPEALSSDPSERNTNETGGAGQTLKDNQVRFRFHVNNKNWSEQDQYFSNWIVNIVDEKGDPITVQELKTISVNLDMPNVSIVDVAANIKLEGYQFKKASAKGYSDFQKQDYENIIDVERNFTNLIVWQSNTEPYQYQYVENNNKFGRDRINRDGDTYNNHATITFVYTKVTPLTEVETVDSQKLGVDIQMFDYSTPTPAKTWAAYGDGSLKQGRLKKELNSDGIPVGAMGLMDGKPLSESFSATSNNYQGKANHLFRKDIYDNPDTKGTFYYSSFENYAYWKESNDEIDKEKPYDFTVYDQIGTPSDENAYFYKRGNFMPYNKIEAGKFSSNSNYYDEDGKNLDEESLRYGEKLYKTQQSGAPGAQNGNDYWFGMVMSSSFTQLEGGRYNGQDMVYEFNGDDDLWVFVDGVLVLDLGGIHDAHSGSINFATGEVQVKDSRNVNGSAVEIFHEPTNIKEQFKNTEKGKSMSEEDWDGNTFSDYSNHEIKIFYMERGGGASNCKMKFNLPVMPKDSITVRKEVTNINEGSYSDVNFNFRLFLEDNNATEVDKDTVEKNGTFYSLAKNKTYTMDGETLNTGDDGKFTLHHGQQAVFEEIADRKTKYILQEISVDQNRYDEFKVNGQAVQDGNIIPSETETGKYIIQTDPLAIDKNAFVTFKNHCDSENLHDLDITKKMIEGQESNDTFQIQVKIGGQLYNGKYKINGVDSGKTCQNGNLEIKPGQTIKIENIAADTSFEVIENYDKDNYENPQYTISEATVDSTTDKAAGKIEFKKNAKVEVTNTRKLGSLKITKTITDDSKVDYMDGDPIFTFKITGPNNIEGQEPQVFYRTLRLSKDVGKTASIIIDNLPIGEYTVEELNTMRYTCTSDNPQTDTVQQNNTEETKNTPPTEFSFTNQLTNEDYFSHTDVVENSFKIGEDGTVTVEKHKVPEGQVPDGTTPVQPSNE
ncbi:hypothetical protein [Eubacterium callanderi]|uniref:DUF7601 domain-containing protein n=1 Tax=Eubacterium callanderi TaxID=53442 RepID=UPI00399AC7C0